MHAGASHALERLIGVVLVGHLIGGPPACSTPDEARRIALHIANYFVFNSLARIGVSGAVEMFLALRG